MQQGLFLKARRLSLRLPVAAGQSPLLPVPRIIYSVEDLFVSIWVASRFMPDISFFIWLIGFYCLICISVCGQPPVLGLLFVFMPPWFVRKKPGKISEPVLQGPGFKLWRKGSRFATIGNYI